MPRRSAFAIAIAVVLLCAGCASPIKPAVLDTSGAKMRQAAVQVQFHNTGGNPRLAPKDLASEYILAMGRQAPRISEGALEIVRPGAAATHLIQVEATLLSRTHVIPGYWDACLYQAKNGQCQGGQTADTTNFTRVRLHLQVIERATGKTIYKSDDDASGKVLIDDRAIDQAAEGAARATLKALKESKLI